MMNKEEFLNQLEQLLSDIPEEERHDALEYYRDFFEDSTKDDREIIEELGSPSIVAENIRQGIFEDGSRSTVKHQIQKYEIRDKNKDKDKKENVYKEPNKNRNHIATALIILMVILTFPFWIGIVIPIGAVLFGLIIVMIVIVFVLLVVGIAGCGAGIGAIVGVISSLIGGVWAVSLGYAAKGCFSVALGLICIVIFIEYTFKFLPWLLRGGINLIKRIFNRGEM